MATFRIGSVGLFVARCYLLHARQVLVLLRQAVHVPDVDPSIAQFDRSLRRQGSRLLLDALPGRAQNLAQLLLGDADVPFPGGVPRAAAVGQPVDGPRQALVQRQAAGLLVQGVEIAQTPTEPEGQASIDLGKACKSFPSAKSTRRCFAAQYMPGINR